MALSLGDIAIGAQGLYLGDILIGADNMNMAPPVPAGPLAIDWIVIGGGGGGGFRGDSTDKYRGGSGGGGGIITGSAIIQPSSSLETRTGRGGFGATSAAGTSTGGVQSSLQIGLDVFVALGGGRGGTGNDVNPGGTMQGGDGGSGGGGASLFSATNTLIHVANGGSKLQLEIYGGFGMNGCNGSTTPPPSINSRGGDGGTSVNVTNTGCPFRYTPGFNWNNIAQFSIGGDAGDTTQQNVLFSGFGGNANSNGSYGEILIRYAGTEQKATGGTSTAVIGDYFYHSFAYQGSDNQYISAFVYNP
jgi:hypothetical protein